LFKGDRYPSSTDIESGGARLGWKNYPLRDLTLTQKAIDIVLDGQARLCTGGCEACLVVFRVVTQGANS
jgi:hypothetical protein